MGIEGRRTPRFQPLSHVATLAALQSSSNNYSRASEASGRGGGWRSWLAICTSPLPILPVPWLQPCSLGDFLFGLSLHRAPNFAQTRAANNVKKKKRPRTCPHCKPRRARPLFRTLGWGHGGDRFADCWGLRQQED